MSQLRPISISSSQRKGTTVLTIVGPVSASGGDLMLRAAIMKALAEGEVRIVIDFSTLSAIDSSGLGELVRASRVVATYDGRMAWAGCPTTMLDLLEIVGVTFDGVDFVDSVEEGIRTLNL